MHLREISDAIKAGRRFRHSTDIDDQWRTHEDGSNIGVRWYKILDDQWVLESKQVPITREKLAEAWDETYITKEGYNNSKESNTFAELCKKLGL